MSATFVRIRIQEMPICTVIGCCIIHAVVVVVKAVTVDKPHHTMRCVNIYAALVVAVLLVLQLTEAASPHNQPRFLGRRHRKLHGGSATCAKLGGRCAEWSACNPAQGKKMPIQSTDLCPAPSGKDQSVWVCCFDHDLAKKGT